MTASFLVGELPFAKTQLRLLLIVSIAVMGIETTRTSFAKAQPTSRVIPSTQVHVTATSTMYKGWWRISVRLQIQKGWRIYGHGVPDDLQELRTAVVAQGHCDPKSVIIEYPAGRKIADPAIGDYEVYEGNVAVEVKLKCDSNISHPFILKITYLPTSTICGLLETRYIRIE